MSLQIFLQGRIDGIEGFLRRSAGDFESRAQWVTLAGEIAPRALLEALGLSRVLLGSAAGGQFLLVLPAEAREQSLAFCRQADEAIRARSGGELRLLFASTENLGAWSDIRKRLAGEIRKQEGTPAAGQEAALFGQPVPKSPPPFTDRYATGTHLGWSPETEDGPLVRVESGGWVLGEEVPFAAHSAPNDQQSGPATLPTLARRAQGKSAWGVLRADVDGFAARLERAVTAEEHLQISVMYAQFVSGELQMRCSAPEYWQKVHILHAGGQSFAVAGAWDALTGLARDMQRLFALFAGAGLRDLAGTEGKTISMAIALAPEFGSSLASVYSEAGRRLDAARAAAGRDCISVFGRTVDWKQMADAAGLQETMTRLIRDFRVPRHFLDEIAAFYEDGPEQAAAPRRINVRVERPWRFYRRLQYFLPPQVRGRDYSRLRAELIGDFTGRSASQVRLRPQGRVALEWAGLSTGRN